MRNLKLNQYNIEALALSLSWFMAIIMASMGIRLGEIFSIPNWKPITTTIFLFNTGVGFIILFKHRWSWAVYSLLFYLILFAHAFVMFYKPSFAPGISFNNYYVMADFDSNPWVISSTISFDIAKLYLNTFFKFLFPALAATVISKQNQKLVIKGIILAFIIGFLANSVLATYQGVVDLNFWAQGSGTAVEAGRAPAFLEASGSSSVYFAAMVVAIFWNLVFTSSTSSALWSGLLLLIGITGGVFAGGRVFFTSCLISMSIGLILCLFKCIKNREQKRLFFILGICGIVVTLFVQLFFIHPSPDSKILVHSVVTILSKKLSVKEALETLDEIRFGHILVMWKAFTENFWIGTGLGSTLANVYTYGYELKINKLLNDFPSCFYLQLMSELGITGLILVAFIIIIWICQLSIFISNKINFSESIFFKYQNQIGWIVPASCGAVTSILVSLIIGIHLVFPIISSIAALSLAVALHSIHNALTNRVVKSPIWERFWKFTLPCLTGYLFFISSVQVLNPPRIPAFRWLERGMPQIPFHLNGEIEGRSGYWVSGGMEILINKKTTDLYILHPDVFFPVTVKTELLNTSAKKVQIKQFTLQKRQGIKIELPNQMMQECLTPVTPSNFCSLRIKTNPPWHSGPFEMGVFIVDPEAKFSRFGN